MFGLSDLKPEIKITSETVQCPVMGCSIEVPRQRRRFRRDEQFLCPKHNIYISPSTFEYENIEENFLWQETYDLSLLQKISEFKRENRMRRDNSEDTITWNVIRFLEKEFYVASWLNSQDEISHNQSEVIYWSYSQNMGKSWSELNKAREQFGEAIKRSSEPDIIIRTDKALFFVEVKLGSTNRTSPTNVANRKKYETGGNRWFEKVFASSFENVAIEAEKYELMRFWLLGTWISSQIGLPFRLVSLVIDRQDKNIEEEFKIHIREAEERYFTRWSWESLYIFIESCPSQSQKEIAYYMRNKSLGYDKNRKIVKAFAI